MIVTEKEAAELACHRRLGQDEGLCIGSQCMAWKWVGTAVPFPCHRNSLQSWLERGYRECAVQPSGLQESYIQIEMPQENRTGCCGLVYPTDD
jgi:hypothetical protein